MPVPVRLHEVALVYYFFMINTFLLLFDNGAKINIFLHADLLLCLSHTKLDLILS